MEFLRTNFPLLIPLAPLAAAIWSVFPSSGEREKSYRFGLIAHVIALVAAVVVAMMAVTQRVVATVVVSAS